MLGRAFAREVDVIPLPALRLSDEEIDAGPWWASCSIEMVDNIVRSTVTWGVTLVSICDEPVGGQPGSDSERDPGKPRRTDEHGVAERRPGHAFCPPGRPAGITRIGMPSDRRSLSVTLPRNSRLKPLRP